VPSRARALSLAAPIAAALALAALWAPWVRTGRESRSAFELVSALRGAGMMDRAPAEALFAVVAVVPGLAAATWVLWAARYRRASAAAAAVIGALVCATSLTVRAVADRHAAPSLLWATTAAAFTLGLGVLALLTNHRKALP
jgi:hypothetical protein